MKPAASVKRMWPRQRPTHERGAVLVELALVLLPLVMVLCGTIDLARGFMFLDQLHNAAQAGALYARNLPTQVSDTPDTSKAGTCNDPNNLQYQIANEQSPGGTNDLTALGYTLTVTDTTTGKVLSGCGPDASPAATVSAGDVISVQLSAPFSIITPLLSHFLGPITLHSTVKMVAQ